MGCSVLAGYAIRADAGLLSRVEGATLDIRFRMRGPVVPDPEIAIIAIDQRSLDTVGRWPWSRSDLARLVDAIGQGNSAKPKAIVLDIAFPQVEQAHYQLVEQKTLSQHLPFMLIDAGQLRDPDLDLAQAIQRSGRVVLSSFFLTSTPGGQRLDPGRLASSFSIPILIGELGDNIHSFVRSAKGAEPNIEQLQSVAAATGFFNIFPDPDGIMRHKDMILLYGDDLYPSLEISALRVAMGLTRDDLACRLASYGIDYVAVGEQRIHTDEQGRIMLNYRGPAGTFQTYSAVDVISGKIDSVEFANRIVFVGVTALGNFDVAITPFAPQGFPGVEVHATALDNIKNQRALVRPAWYVLFDLCLIWSLAIIVAMAFASLRPWLAGATAVTLLVVLWQLVGWLFNTRNYVLSLTVPLISLVTTLILVALYRLLFEVRLQTKMKRALAPYVPLPVAQRIAADPDRARLQGARREITVLFVDIRSFSKLSAQVSPEKMVEFLSEFAHEVSEAVFDNQGLLDKFIGDGAMAFWGAPLISDDHVDCAINCAKDIQQRITQLAKRHAQDEFGRTTVGVGIATGEAVVGALGSMRRLDYTAVGEVVNLAQRLEKLNKKLGSRVLLSKASSQKAGPQWNIESLGAHQLIEGSEPIDVYELPLEDK
ncbi:MAG: adenylate/guanylate cyclase domain-containing protein [Candidatus Alcyoniella australis]|nr:adenylate/guanylate cyclase domain-containing protein [Candidatus Alcyoniella australis]